MEELTVLLSGVEDSYDDFVSAMLHYANKRASRKESLTGFLKGHPEAKTSDIIRFVSEQSDFAEDAAYMNVG